MSLPHTQTAPVYVAGGTVQAGGGIYVRRAADDQLYAACLRGGLAYVLNSRQVGKSSLMIRAAERLLEEGGRVAIIDFTTMGANLTADDWYRGIVKAVAEQLDLGLEGGAWWDFQAGLGATDRFTRFFREALERLPGQRITIFFDEIDTTRALPFHGVATDDFFAAMRGLHLERAQNRDMARLGIVLIGAATPSDLIENPDRTPFNLGERIEIADFTEVEAAGLLPGSGIPPEEAQQVLRAVIAWTGIPT